MTAVTADFITDLDADAVAAQREEIRFRESVAAEIAKRERARAFAFRRLDLAKTMAAAAAGAADKDAAVTAQLAALKRDLDWHSDTEARIRILEAWRPVAEAVWAAVTPREGDEANADAPPARDAVPRAMADFERWYEAQNNVPFLAVFDVEIPEFPVVEF